jgi:hypothetical protein
MITQNPTDHDGCNGTAVIVVPAADIRDSRNGRSVRRRGQRETDQR